VIFLPFIVVAIVLMVMSYLRHRDAEARARALRRSGFGFMLLYVALGSLFIIGETFSDPGGWAALGWVALWFVPMVSLSLFAWFRCDRARPVLTALTAVVVGLSCWYALDSHAWRAFENGHGPVRGIAIFALSAALATFGYRRPRPGGLLLLVACAVPVVLSTLASGGLGMSSLGALTAPAIITGVLYLWSSGVEQSAQVPGTSSSGPTSANPTRPR
jgi:hypothetical protein